MADNMNFVGTANVDWVTMPAASQSTTKDGTATLGTNIFLAFTAGSSGSFVRSVKICPKGTNVATVIRLFVNNGSTNGTAANNELIAEITAPATSVSEVAQIGSLEIPLNIALDATFRLLICYGTSVAAGFGVTTFGYNY